MNKFKFYEDNKVKMVRSENVNYNFDKITGYTETWGKTRADEVIYSDIGPHILILKLLQFVHMVVRCAIREIQKLELICL